jgi:succinate dehydrogenase flavoprotein subunit
VAKSGERLHLETDVLIIGAGAAGMSAAIAAHEDGADVLLLDRSLIGRGGATVMAQMTVAVALGDEEPDDPEAHFADTIRAGRGLCDPHLAEMLCREAPDAIRQMESWHVGWARHADGRLRQAQAPGHDRPRCVYVDFLNTGPAVSRTLRAQVQRRAAIRRVGELCVTDIVTDRGEAIGALGYSLVDGGAVSIAAKAVIIAAGGLTRLYRRNSGSANMGGDGYALALRAGAELIDMEFVQFFPIGHLAPRLIGMDPIMWDPFRYKLGGRLLNADRREFTDAHGVPEGGRYVATRDLATYAILKEVEAGRGSPAGGAYLSFEHVAPERLREAFGPVIDRLARNGIDLARQPVEVAPIAHYHMGGIRVGADCESSVSRLFAAGEAIGGANGANRLSGNAISEALVFGRRAGHAAAQLAAETRALPWRDAAAHGALELVAAEGTAPRANLAALLAALQGTMEQHVGPFRSAAGLEKAREEITRLGEALGSLPPGAPSRFAAERIDWFDARNMLLVVEAVTCAAIARRESRGAHQREDFPHLDPAWTASQVLRLENDAITLDRLATAPDPTLQAAS